MSNDCNSSPTRPVWFSHRLVLVPATPAEEDLPTWAGLPCDPQNRGCYLRGRLRSSASWATLARSDALLIVDQNDVEFVQPGQKVSIKLDELRTRTFKAQITQVSAIDLDQVPAGFAQGSWELSSLTDKSGRERPIRRCLPGAGSAPKIRITNAPGIPRQGKNSRRSRIARKSGSAYCATNFSVLNQWMAADAIIGRCVGNYGQDAGYPSLLGLPRDAATPQKFAPTRQPCYNRRILFGARFGTWGMGHVWECPRLKPCEPDGGARHHSVAVRNASSCLFNPLFNHRSDLFPRGSTARS